MCGGGGDASRSEDGGNLIVQGDNLLALKALLPRYAGQVKCIYIDPPYNTGNEGWVYDDNVKAPEIQKWLHQVVGKEAEDLSRHDKWLCMMYPRLQLLKRFLTEDGLIFVSIDDNEITYLRPLMDEVFGAPNFVEQMIWKKSYGGGAKEKFIVRQHEYILVYALNKSRLPDLWLAPDAGAEERYYKYRDHRFAERGPYRVKPLEATKSMDRRENLVYPIPAPDGTQILPKRQWWWSRERTYNSLKNDELVFVKGKDSWSVSYKQYLRNEEGEQRGAKPFSIIDGIYTQAGTADVRELFDDQVVFQFPKPVALIQRILQIGTLRDSLVLDCFGGSGTTGHAVLNQNAEDGGTRQFILVEMKEDIARTITSERVRRVIERERKMSDSTATVSIAALEANDDLFTATPGKGLARSQATAASFSSSPIASASFSFAVLGDTLFDAEGNIRETVTFTQLAEFVWFQQTGAPLPPKSKGKRTPLLGVHRGAAVYLLFNGILGDRTVNGGNVLTRPVLYELPAYDGAKVVYAAACKISELHRRRLNVEFKQIPYQLEVNAWL